MSDEKSVKVNKPLPDPIELAKEAWIIYKARFWTMIGVGVIGYLALIVLFLILGIIGVLFFFILGAKPTPQIIGIEGFLILLFVIASTLLSQWMLGAGIITLKNWKGKEGIRENYKEAKPFILSLLGTTLLSALLTFGSIFVFIIPAILFGIWFSYYRLVVILEKKSGLLALHTSREYIKGRFWGVVWRMIAVYLPMVVLSLVFSKSGKPGPIHGIYQLVSLLLVPFYAAYSFVLFTHIQKTAEKVTSVPKNNKIVYLLVPVIGYIIVIVTGILVVPLAVRTAVQFGEAMLAQQQPGSVTTLQPSTQIANGLIIYYIANKKFPKTLSEITNAKMFPEVPHDAKTGLPYRYTQVNEGSDFKLCTPVSVRPEKCVSAESKNFDL